MKRARANAGTPMQCPGNALGMHVLIDVERLSSGVVHKRCVDCKASITVERVQTSGLFTLKPR